MNKNHREKIILMEYNTIEKGFYRVLVVSDDDKIIAEGNVCGGVLMELMERTKKDKGKISRVRSKEFFWKDEKEVELKELRIENKILNNKLKSINKISKND